MKRTLTAHLKRSLALLELAKSKMEIVSIRWREGDPGPWSEAGPRWWISKGRIWLQFRGGEKTRRMQIASVLAKPWGIQVQLSDPKRPIAETLDFIWQASVPESSADDGRIWDVVHCWLSRKFPMHQVMKAVKRPDRMQTLSGSFLRVRFRHGGREGLLIAADSNAGEDIHRMVSQSLLWISALTRISHQVSSRGGADGHGYKARDGRIPQAYSTVRRGVRPSTTQ